MKKYIKFALMICLLTLGTAAVLSVAYPNLQPVFLEWGSAALTKTWDFIKRVGEAFLIVFFGE